VESRCEYRHDLGACDYRRGRDWWKDLLTTYTQHSELLIITAPLLISTVHRSPQHPLRLFPSCCVFNSRSIATASNSGDSSASLANVLSSQPLVQNWTLSRQLTAIKWTIAPSLLNLPCTAQLNCQPLIELLSRPEVLAIYPRGEPNRKLRLQQSL
jgi:hypothetical protein